MNAVNNDNASLDQSCKDTQSSMSLLPMNPAFAAITDSTIIRLFKQSYINSNEYFIITDLDAPKFPFTVAYAVDMRNRLNGLVMQSLIDRPSDGDMSGRYYFLCLQFTTDADKIIHSWTPKSFLRIGNEYARKLNALSDSDCDHFINQIPVNDIPDHFTDSDLRAALGLDGTIEQTAAPDVSRGIINETTVVIRDRYKLYCGLLIKVRTGVLRLIKRSVIHVMNPDAIDVEVAALLFRAVKYFTVDITALEQHWSPRHLFLASMELACKAINIPGYLQKTLDTLALSRRSCALGSCACSYHLAPAPDEIPLNRTSIAEYSNTNLFKDELPSEIYFEKEFLSAVSEYHSRTSRPEGTFQENIDDEETTLLQQLAGLPREVCPGCNGRRQVAILFGSSRVVAGEMPVIFRTA